MRNTLMGLVFIGASLVPLSAAALTSFEVEERIQNLMGTVRMLQAQLLSAQAAQPVAVSTGVSYGATPRWCTVLNDAPRLVRGSRGMYVAQLQEFLAAEGMYGGGITEVFGPKTEEALKRWQAAQGVVSSGGVATTGWGAVGAQTRAAARKVCESKYDAAPLGACTKEYVPVCGQPRWECPSGQFCATVMPEPRTYGNICELKRASAEYLYEGQCGAPETTHIPNSCKVWYDGCNTCSRSAPGSPLMCTLMACFTQAPAYCREYFGASADAAPTISGVSGPTVVRTGAQGTWVVEARDPENGTLSYRVVWGDEGLLQEVLYAVRTALPYTGYTQTATFMHTYHTPGTYTPVFYVRDQYGNEVKTSISVSVSEYAPTSEAFTAVPSSGTAPLTVTFYNRVHTGRAAQHSIDFGDGTSAPAGYCYAPADYCEAPGSTAHTYTRAGTYTALLYREASGVSRQIVGTAVVTVGGNNANVSLLSPVSGARYPGSAIPVSWSVPLDTAAGMYLSVEGLDGIAGFSTKVVPAAQSAALSLSANCNGFFSDAIDGDCSSFWGVVPAGTEKQVRVRAVTYTPASACFGFCAPGSPQATVLSETYSGTFTVVR